MTCFSELSWNYSLYKINNNTQLNTENQSGKSLSPRNTNSGCSNNDQPKINEMLRTYEEYNKSEDSESSYHNQGAFTENIMEIRTDKLPYLNLNPGINQSPSSSPTSRHGKKLQMNYHHLLRCNYSDPASQFPFIFDVCPSDVRVYFRNMNTCTDITQQSNILTDCLSEYISPDIIKLVSILKQVSLESSDWQSLKKSTDYIVDILCNRYLTDLDLYLNGESLTELESLPIIGLRDPPINHVLELAQISNILFTRRTSSFFFSLYNYLKFCLNDCRQNKPKQIRTK